jgi:hypothetical protein
MGLCSHLNHCLWREIPKLVLRGSYRDKEVGKHSHMCATLAHTPPETTDKEWLHIMQEALYL